MLNSNVFIMATYPLPPGEWLPLTESLFKNAGYYTIRINNKLFIRDEIKKHKGILYSEGDYISRIWLGPKLWGLAITSKRIYFEEDGLTYDNRDEHLIVGENKPPYDDSSIKIRKQWKLLNELIQGFNKYGFKIASVKEIALEPQTIFIQDNKLSIDTLNQLYKAYSFDYVPEDMCIFICPLDNVSRVVADNFAIVIDKCMRQRKASCKITIVNQKVVEDSLDNLQKEGRHASEGICLLFILPTKSINLKREYLDLFNELENYGVPFRRAYADDPLNYSVPDQLPSLLMAAGGRPHKMLIRAKNKAIWTVGIDLGHSTEQNHSRLAISLVDPYGLPIKSWVSLQRLDESLSLTNLRKILEILKDELYLLDNDPHIVVLRDGRFTEKDQVNICQEVLGNKASIFEYRKSGNPQIFHLSESGIPIVANAPCAAIISDSHTLLIVTGDRLNPHALPNVAKVVWVPEWNCLELTPDEIANVLLNTTNAPGLGLRQRHLPACIYWADGVAKTNDEDLRFRGQRIFKLHNNL